MYKKRSGTSGVHGHLYETKLLSLILFKAQRDDNIDEIHLATNMDGVGAFDDICFKAKVKGHNRPIVVFIQAKHSNDRNIVTLSNKNNLVKYFNSYLTIKKKFDPASNDKIFNVNFNETDCYFVIYTIAKGNANNNKIEKPPILDDLIATGQVDSQPTFDNENVQILSKIITATALAENFAKLLYEKVNNQCVMLSDLNNDIILRYHVILAQKVVDVTEIVNSERRHCKFRDDFFNTTDTFLAMFRDNLYLEILKKQKIDETQKDQALSKFLSDPSGDTLRHVIGHAVLYEDGKFKFAKKHVSTNLKEELRQIYLPACVVKSTIKQAALDILKSESTKFTVPSKFGNVDIEKNNIKNVKSKILNFISSVKSVNNNANVVTIDETIKDGLRVLNNGLGSAVGNILTYDKDGKSFKFTDDNSSLGPNAKIVLKELMKKITDLHQYTFDVKVLKFPHLSYDVVDERLTRDFLNKLIFYTNQAPQDRVGKILKDLILSHQGAHTHNFRIKTDAIFLKYHDIVQKWWMASDSAPYLTKEPNIYQQTVNDIVNNPLLSITSMIYMNKIQTSKYKFKASATISMSGLVDIFSRTSVDTVQPEAVITTDSAVLTVTKLATSLKGVYLVLDLNYILDILSDDLNQLISELQSTNNGDTFIIVYDAKKIITLTYSDHEKLKKIVAALNNKKKIIVTNKTAYNIIVKYFPVVDNTVKLDERHSLIHFEQESQKNIIDKFQVIFQGQSVGFDLLLDEKSTALIDGNVLNNVILDRTVVIGDLLTDSNYDKNLFVDRSVRGDSTLALRTLRDIKRDVVLLLAEPGMGKTTLLTHLSLQTKFRNRRLWIVTINLLDHSGELRNLQKNNTTIDILETLKFMCLVILKTKKMSRDLSLDLRNVNICLGKKLGEVYLKEFTGDEWAEFELKMFLHFYNKGNVLFLFDGFDEIYPHYANTVVKFVNILKDYQRDKVTSKSSAEPIWITSRTYNEIEKLLQQHFGASYELENFTGLNTYLDKFWKANLIFTQSNRKFIDKVEMFLNNTSAQNIINTATLSFSLGRVHASIISYLITNYPHVDGTMRWCELYHTVKLLRQKMPWSSEQMSTSTVNQTRDIECPLFTYLIASYFVQRLKDGDEVSFNIDISALYKWLVETIFEKHYKEKKKMDLDITYNIMEYESKLPLYIDTHKRIAAYAILREDVCNIFDSMELNDIDVTIKSIEKGEEVTGLTCSVSNNIPHFVHMTFAKYLAVEYLFDLMKAKRRGRQKVLANVLYNQIDSFCVWVNHKLEKGELFLHQLLEIHDCIPENGNVILEMSPVL